MKTLTIITGASKGLGFELTRQSLKAGDTVVTMERRPSKALVEEADKIGCNFIQFTADLLDRKGAVELLMWLLSDKEYAEHDASPQGAVDCIRVNFEIPVLLTQAFLNETRSWKGERRVMNISSGAGRKSVPGWAMYCSTKAALDRFTAVTAEDQLGKPNPARLRAVGPGVVNTGMQGSIRDSSKEDFPNVDRFIDLEKDGKLQSPEDTAKRLLNYLNSDEFGKEPISDIRNISVGD